MTKFIKIQVALRLLAAFALVSIAENSLASGKYDGGWLTKLSCDAHGETPAYSWQFVSTIKDNNFHGQHSVDGAPGYLVIEGKLADDGSAKLTAKGKVTNSHAHGVFAMKGDNYGYNIKAQFDDAKGTGTRDEGAGILGRPCAFEFVKQDANGDPKPMDSKGRTLDSNGRPLDSDTKPADATANPQHYSAGS